MDRLNIDFTKGLVRVLFLLVSTILVILFLPHESASYDFSVGKPWKYGQIIADFDFPIYKSEQVIQTERDSVLKHFQPYYEMDKTVGEMQIKNFNRDINNGIIEIPWEYRKYLLEKMEEVYAAGIMDSHDYSSVMDSNYTSIRIEKGTLAEAQSTKKIFTTRSAYIYILSLADSAHYNKDLISKCNVNEYLANNLVYDKKKSLDRRQDLLNSISYASGMVQKGEKIVDRGTLVTSRTASIIESLMKESQKRNADSNTWLRSFGKGTVVFLLLATFLIYLYLYRRDYVLNLRCVTLLYFLITLFSIATSLLVRHGEQLVYYIPISAVAIFVSVFLDSRTAFITNLIAILVSSQSLQDPFLFVIVQTFSAFVAIYSLKQLATRSQLIHTVFLITALTELFMLGIDFSQGYTLKMLGGSWYYAEAINGVFLLFTYPFLFVMEKVFGFTSPITLIEISNINHPLLRELSKQAQGTFNHSMQVANLSSEIASKIGADVLLVRTGALFHDIGKIKNPAYFTENQGHINPHNTLPEERSAQIIIQHVADGIELADRYGLPKVIKDFIQTHHGNSLVSYFFVRYQNEHPDKEVNKQLFTYPGPNPSTKEQAILMIADSVEAASRSLKETDDETLQKLVDSIVDSKMKDGYLKDCPITFADIEMAKKVLVSSLKTIYHTRISYPTLNTPSPKKKRKKWK